MSRWHEWLCFVTTAGIAILGLQNPGKCEGVDKGFYATVRQNFAGWDSNHDCALSPIEINMAFQNTMCRGRAAAAIAVLQKIEATHYHHHEPLENFTLSQINEWESSAESGHDKSKSTFRSCLKKIEAASWQLYAHGLPKIDEIHQGGANDCYFLAPLAALVHERPEQLVRLIETNTDGSYTAHFHGEVPVRVPCPSQAEISAYNSNGGDGLWLPVMVKRLVN